MYPPTKMYIIIANFLILYIVRIITLCKMKFRLALTIFPFLAKPKIIEEEEEEEKN